MKFTIVGKIIPYVRMTQRSKYADERARRYLKSQESIGWQLKQQMLYAGAEMINRKARLAVAIRMRAPGGLHRWDLDNGVKAVLDAAQGIVFEDDRWIDRITAERCIGEEDITEMTVELIRTRGDASPMDRERSIALTHTIQAVDRSRAQAGKLTSVPTPACIYDDERDDALRIVE